MAKLKKGIRKLIVGLVGFPLLVVGIILIPLPGPGILVCLLAFFILSLEFEWADKYFGQAKGVIRRIWQESQEKAARFEEKHAPKNDKPDK